MRLKKALRNLTLTRRYNFKNIDIEGICTDSRYAERNEIFIALKGTRVDGHKYIDEALSQGVSCIIVQSKKSEEFSKRFKNVIIIGVADTKAALIKLTENFYRVKIKGLKLIGVTGTNGKTTTTYLIESILNSAGFKTGLIGTIDYRLPGKREVSINTTPALNDLYKYFCQMKKANVKYCIMEVSSHALTQDRVGGLRFSRAIFTNLTRDHLDYHKNFNNYFKSKRKLFHQLERRGGYAILNIDDPYGERLLETILSRKLTYAVIKKADANAIDIKSDLNGIRFAIRYKKERIEINSKLRGTYNVYNILAAATVALSLKIKSKHIIEGARRLKEVPGRLALAARLNNIRIFVDYAHTPQAMKVVLQFLKTIQNRRKEGRIILVFGCGGERDKIKRPQMGHIASRYADFTILTTDNPRSEDPKDIAEEVAMGLSKNNYLIILDRYEAIKRAISRAKENDIVLIAGKGHEQVQIFKDKIEVFDDRKAVKEVLNELKRKNV
ncbi:MAG: UDP-N-acetylmuramoyl-L-alanyl-D-glutamate--2,6-diaminopimelate ligase [Candidatus Omnitrophota bacterium]